MHGLQQPYVKNCLENLHLEVLLFLVLCSNYILQLIFQAEKFGDSFVLEAFISPEVLKGISQAVSILVLMQKTKESQSFIKK